MTPAPAVAEALTAIEQGAPAHSVESACLDFKTVGRSLADSEVDLAEAAACFANAAGGWIVVGVTDRAVGEPAFVGVDLDCDRLQRRIYEITTPALIVGVDEHERGGRRLVIITVPRSPDVHQVKGRATERVGTSCEPMTAARIASVMSSRRGDDWSTGDSGVPLERAATAAIDEARRLLTQAPDTERRRWSTLSTPDLLRVLGLVAPSGALTQAGVLLLVPDETRALVSYTHRRTSSGELSTNQTLTAPGLIALQRALELIDARADRTPINLATGQQLFIADLPEIAVREAVVNAVVHRDYQSTGLVQIEHSSTRMSVTSPGSFVLGVSPSNILTVSSRPRNAALADVARKLTLAEMAGVGVDRMYAEMLRFGHRPPVFTADQYRVTVTLNGGAPNSAVTRFVTTLPEERRSDPDTLLVLVTLLQVKTVTPAGIAPVLQKDPDEVEIVLHQLSTPPIDLVERTRESANARHGTYRLRAHVIAELGPAVTYRRRTGDDTDRKIIEMVREAGYVNGRMVRTLFDVDTPTASRILADLVEREVLVKTSQAQRGPSVRYGSGPRFPKRSRNLERPD